MQEQQAQTEGKREHHADRNVALGEFLAEQPHGDSRDERESDEAAERRKPEQDRPGRAGETDMRQRMTGKGLAAQNEKEPYRPGENRRDARGGKGGPHEVVVKHGRRRERVRARVRDDALRARLRRRRP